MRRRHLQQVQGVEARGEGLGHIAVGPVEGQQPAPFDPPGRRQVQHIGEEAVLALGVVVVLGQEMAGAEPGQLGVGQGDARFAGQVPHQTEEILAVQKAQQIGPDRRRLSGLNQVIDRVVVVQILEVVAGRGLDRLSQSRLLIRAQGRQPGRRQIDMTRPAPRDDIVFGARRRLVQGQGVAVGQHTLDLGAPCPVQAFADRRALRLVQRRQIQCHAPSPARPIRRPRRRTVRTIPPPGRPRSWRTARPGPRPCRRPAGRSADPRPRPASSDRPRPRRPRSWAR